MKEFRLSREQVDNFLDDGFLIIPNLLDAGETELLLTAASADPMVKENVFDVSDRGWRSCVVYTHEVISEIWRTNDAMSSLRSS